MKLLLLAAAVLLAGCEGMPQRTYNPNYVPQQPYLLPMPTPMQPNRYQAPAQRQPMNCTTRYVGNTAYTDCY